MNNLIPISDRSLTSIKKALLSEDYQCIVTMPLYYLVIFNGIHLQVGVDYIRLFKGSDVKCFSDEHNILFKYLEGLEEGNYE